jgi:hypothetical protein
MRNNQLNFLTLGLVAVFMLFSTSLYAGTGSLSVSATVIVSASVTQNTALSFGSFALTDNTVAGEVDTAGPDTNIDVFTASTVGVVDIAGAASETVNISVSTPVTLSDGANTMSAALSVPSATVVLDGSGAATSNVNGVLTVGIGQAPGSYTGSATVTVNY